MLCWSQVIKKKKKKKAFFRPFWYVLIEGLIGLVLLSLKPYFKINSVKRGPIEIKLPNWVIWAKKAPKNEITVILTMEKIPA